MVMSFMGHKTHLELVGWHNGEKVMLLGTPDQALWPALALTLMVIPIAAMTYRWIEKPAIDRARAGLLIPDMSWLTLAVFSRRSRRTQLTSSRETEAASGGGFDRLQAN